MTHNAFCLGRPARGRLPWHSKRGLRRDNFGPTGISERVKPYPVNATTAEIKHRDLFAESRATPNDYPVNIVRSELLGHALKSLQTRFKDERLFDDSYRSLYVKDLRDDKQGIIVHRRT